MADAGGRPRRVGFAGTSAWAATALTELAARSELETDGATMTAYTDNDPGPITDLQTRIAELENALLELLRCNEMQVGELRHGVPHGIV